MLQLRAGMSWVVDAEANCAWPSVRDVRHDGVVGVDHERRLRWHRRDRGTPALCDDLELPVAIELIAEEVAESDDPRPRSRDRFGKRPFVDLEQPQIRLARGDERRRDSGEEIRAGAVPGKTVIASEDLCRHRGRRRLPVRRRHQRDAVRKPRRESIHGTGIELPEHLPGNRGAAAAPRETREAAERTRQ